MIVVIGLHLAALVTYALLPEPAVIEIPVRTLNIKLGSPTYMPQADETEPINALPPLEMVALPDTSVKETVSQKTDITPPPQKTEDGKTFTSFTDFMKDKSSALKPKPIRKPTAPAPKPKANTKAASIPAKTNLLEIEVKEQVPSLSNTDQLKRFVRQIPSKQPITAMNNAGNDKKMLAKVTIDDVMLRYEQRISSWLDQHKTYPQMARQLGQHGTPIVRIRIDRSGNVRFSSIDRTSGYQMIDRAALDMVKRANPLPPVPAEYPGGALMEFKIPVQFMLQ